MDGIFGVGLAEMLIIVVVILVIGGPKNAVKWARDLGVMLSKVRKMWSAMVKELEKEMGDDAKELVKVSQELRQNVVDIRTAPQKVIREAAKMIDETQKETKAALQLPSTSTAAITPPPAENNNPKESDTSKYSAWTTKPD